MEENKYPTPARGGRYAVVAVEGLFT
jgi:hypothetical protein